MANCEPLTWTLYPEEDGCIFFTRYHGAIFYIEYFSENIAAAPIVAEFYAKYGGILIDADSYSSLTVGEAAKALIDPFGPIMSELTRQGLGEGLATHTLRDYLYPQQFRLIAQAAPHAHVVEPQVSDERPPYLPPGERINLRSPIASCLSKLKNRYSSQQAELPLAAPGDSQYRPFELLVDNGRTKCFFKAFRPTDGDPIPRATRTELNKYHQIDDAIESGRLASNLRISRLHGVVIDDSRELPQPYRSFGEGERLVGLLLSYIEPCNGYARSSLQHMNNAFIQEHCLRIIDELECLLSALHDADLVWGDAKPANILVDKDNNIWLIDFGGSFTSGWVDEHNSDSMAGDLQGLERIKQWLCM